VFPPPPTTQLSVASTLNTGITRDTAMKTIVSLTYMVVHAERVTLWLVDHEAGTVSVAQTHDGSFKAQMDRRCVSIHTGVRLRLLWVVLCCVVLRCSLFALFAVRTKRASDRIEGFAHSIHFVNRVCAGGRVCGAHRH
jgi:hypothetical protein